MSDSLPTPTHPHPKHCPQSEVGGPCTDGAGSKPPRSQHCPQSEVGGPCTDGAGSKPPQSQHCPQSEVGGPCTDGAGSKPPRSQMSRKRPAVGPYSYDDDEDYVPSKTVKYSEREDVIPKKEKKHTLDSDEEEDNEDDQDGGKNYDVLKEEDIDGQEERTVDFEGETKITPFNMKEELEDGHFDGDGFYHFKKDAEIKDAWLDDIDWIKVKHREGDENKYGSDIESDAESDMEDSLIQQPNEKILAVYIDILSLLKEGESVAKALKRLGGNKKMSSAQKWKLKKAGSLGTGSGDSNMEDFMKLTELTNKLIVAGNMDVYQETYEMINLKVERSKGSAAASAMDMFADEEKDNSENKSKEQPKQEGKGIASFETVSWELRWEDKEDAEIHGPFTNEKMLQWQESGYFKKGAYVRKTTEQGHSWYSTRRIEFDLYV